MDFLLVLTRSLVVDGGLGVGVAEAHVRVGKQDWINGEVERGPAADV